MDQTKITIFSNFFINNEETFLRMKDSFYSFYKIKPCEWIIGVRGNYKIKVMNFLKSNIDNENLFIKILDDKSNWINESRILFDRINYPTVFIWVEDHICQLNQNEFRKIILEFNDNKIDQMVYSFWHNSLRNRINFLDPEFCKFLKFTKLDTRKKPALIKNGFKYLTALPAIYSYDFLKKVLFSNMPLLKRYPKYTPFDFEKKICDYVSSHKYAVPLLEIFAPIDDDHGEYKYGYKSLQQRGNYPLRISREQHLVSSLRKGNSIKYFRFLGKIKLIANIYFFFKRLKFTFSN